jgi:hypothetical protein
MSLHISFRLSKGDEGIYLRQEHVIIFIMESNKKLNNLASEVTWELKPLSSGLSNYDKIKIWFDYQSIVYSPPKNKIDGDFVFRFPKHTFILRTREGIASVLVDETPKNITLDLSFKDTQTCLKIINQEIPPLLLTIFLFLGRKLKTILALTPDIYKTYYII